MGVCGRDCRGGESAGGGVNGPMIFRYTRAQAMADGVLVNLSKLAKDAGFKYPVAVTVGVWEECISTEPKDVKRGQSEKGRAWDILSVLFFNIKRMLEGQDQVVFKVKVEKDGHALIKSLWAKVGSGDQGEPVITIMLVGED